MSDQQVITNAQATATGDSGMAPSTTDTTAAAATPAETFTNTLFLASTQAHALEIDPYLRNLIISNVEQATWLMSKA